MKIKPVYALMLVVAFFWAVGHPLGIIILKQVHPFQLASINLLVGFISAAIYAAGAVFVVFNRGFRLGGDFAFGGSIFSILAAVSSAAYSLGGKKILSRRDPVAVVLIALFSGTLLLTLFTAFTVGFSSLTDALSFIILNERFGWRFYFGAFLILSGIFLANFLAGRAARQAPSASRKP